VNNLRNGYPNLKVKSEKPKISLTLRQKKLLDDGNFMVVFNEVHNQHLQTSVGIVSVLTENNKRVYKNIKDHGTDITYENEFKVKKWYC